MSETQTYASLALKLLDASYEVLPIVPNRKCPNYGIGVKTGHTAAIDIDCPREDVAVIFQNYCLSEIGDAPIRFGKAPKRALY